MGILGKMAAGTENVPYWLLFYCHKPRNIGTSVVNKVNLMKQLRYRY